MANYKPYNNALNGLQRSYSANFEKTFSGIFEISSNPFEVVFDEIDGMERTRVYQAMRDEYPKFADKYTVASFNTGKAIYESNRDYAEQTINRKLPLFKPPAPSKKLLSDNLVPFWELGAMMKKVYDGEATWNWVAGAGARGLADLARNTTLFMGRNDKVNKKADIALSAGACEFCDDVKKSIDKVYKSTNPHWHDRCNCSIVFKYDY